MKKSIPRIGIVLIAVFIGSQGEAANSSGTNEKVLKASQRLSERTMLSERLGLSPESPVSSNAINRPAHFRRGNRVFEQYDLPGRRANDENGKPAKLMPKDANGGPVQTTAAGDENWDDRFFQGGGVDDYAYAIAVSGNDVYVGGAFNGAGRAPANHIAKWDGTKWLKVGIGINSTVYALAVAGSDVYAGGDFTKAGGIAANHIARWDGTKWSALGSGVNSIVEAIAVSGSDIYIGGHFTTAGGVPANHIAKWDGIKWSALGNGVNYGVEAIAVSGSDIYIGGHFTTAGGVPANHIAKWDGTIWSALGSGVDSTVMALAVVSSDVVVGGFFATAGGAPANHIAKWDGSIWSTLGEGVGGNFDGVWVIRISGTDIFAGGDFTTAGGIAATSIAKWDGTKWSALGSGVSSQIADLAVCGRDVFVVGWIGTAGGRAVKNIAKWDGGKWSALGEFGQYLNSEALALAVSGRAVYVGGEFETAGGVPVNYVAQWDGTKWSILGSGVNSWVYAIAISGSDVYVGGNFTRAGGAKTSGIAKWDGAEWSALGRGVNGRVYAIAVSGSDIYIGGYFTTAGGVPANHIAKWDGKKWSSLRSGVGGADDYVSAIVVSGKNVYVGGHFSTAGGMPANGIAKWDGKEWSVLGSGFDGQVTTLAVSGNGLYAGGGFISAGGVSASHIAKWDGTKWSALASEVNGPVNALAVCGSDLYAGGGFFKAGGAEANRIAKWDGTKWSALGSGVNRHVHALAVCGSDVYVGGLFTAAGQKASNHFAHWTDRKSPITVTSPNGGEIWEAASVQKISWTTTVAISKVKLECSTNGGADWATIAGAAPNTGIYAWTVPLMNSSNALIRASDAANAAVNDVSDAPFTISCPWPIIGLSKTSLSFFILKKHGNIPGRPVLITNLGGGALNWTAASSTGWLVLEPASGLDNQIMNVNVADLRSIADGTYSATITISDPKAMNSPAVINVTLVVKTGEADDAPFGEFDSPADGAMTDASTANISGWALDDIGIKSVKIYRQTGAGGRALIGTAKLIAGARPDIEAAYSAYPGSGRAGWSFTLPMNKLPNKGRGAFTLSAYATDVSGKETLLGSHAITGLAAVSAGSSEFTVWVDGAAAGHPIGRANRRNGATEILHMPGKTTRAGTFLLDTTKYPDGWHTVAWSSAEAIGAVGERGSAYFRIQNETQEKALIGEEAEPDSGVSPIIENAEARTPISLSGFFPEDQLSPVYVKRGFDDNQMAEAVYSDEDRLIRIGIPQASRLAIFLNRDASFESEAERYRAYALVGDELRTLPIGASFDSRDGILFWQPGPGFLGDHYFVLVDSLSGTRKTIRIAIL